MAVLRRDLEVHTYGDYHVWSRTYGDEVIDGVGRCVAIHRLEGGHYVRSVLPMVEQTPLVSVPGVFIDWDCLLANIE